jgi:hypothetical protein
MTVTMVAPRPSRAAVRKAATTLAPVEVPGDAAVDDVLHAYI